MTSERDAVSASEANDRIASESVGSERTDTDQPASGRTSGQRRMNDAEIDTILHLVRVTTENEDGCWIPNRVPTRDGYITQRHVGRTWYAHRLALATRGIDIDGLEVHHQCGTRACWNSRHLAAVDRSEHRSIHSKATQARLRAERIVAERAS